MTLAKSPGNPEIEAALEALAIDILREAGTSTLEEKIDALNAATKTYATLRKLPPEEEKGKFHGFQEQVRGTGRGGRDGGAASNGGAVPEF